MKIWNKPTLFQFGNSTVKGGCPSGSAAFEKYVNQASGTQWPCDTSGGVFATTSWYNFTTGQAGCSIAACDQAGGLTAMAATACTDICS